MGDPWWYTELGHKGLDINTDLINFPKILDIVSREQFPIHSRRMRVFKSEHNEAKRACYKILSELPQGDTKALMSKISSIEAFPDNKSVSENKKKICTECKYRGHLAADCWGKCQHCGRY